MIEKKNGLSFPTCFCYESVIYDTGRTIWSLNNNISIALQCKRHTKAKISE